MTAQPRVGGMHETILYASDIETMIAFYGSVIGLEPFPGPIGATGHGLRLPSGAVLLIFDPELSNRPGRGVPPHGATGPGHVAFAIPESSYETWLAHLKACGVEIEQAITWPAEASGEAARSIYFRDPAGNSVELMAGDYWKTAEARES